MLLVDTNVLSEFRKINAGKGDSRVKAWAESVAANTLFVSVITICELQVGAELMERRDVLQGAIFLRALEGSVLPSFEGRILPVDLPIARRCASLHVPDPRHYRDSLIAATALIHQMTVVTRNTVHFEAMNVPVLDPWNV